MVTLADVQKKAAELDAPVNQEHFEGTRFGHGCIYTDVIAPEGFVFVSGGYDIISIVTSTGKEPNYALLLRKLSHGLKPNKKG